MERRLHRPRRVQGLSSTRCASSTPTPQVLVHPESPSSVGRAGRRRGPHIGCSNAVIEHELAFIVADNGILHPRARWRLQDADRSTHLPATAPPARAAHCPWMGHGRTASNPVATRPSESASRRFRWTEPIRAKAQGCITRMLDFVAAHKAKRHPGAAPEPSRSDPTRGSTVNLLTRTPPGDAHHERRLPAPSHNHHEREVFAAGRRLGQRHPPSPSSNDLLCDVARWPQPPHLPHPPRGGLQLLPHRNTSATDNRHHATGTGYAHSTSRAGADGAEGAQVGQVAPPA